MGVGFSLQMDFWGMDGVRWTSTEGVRLAGGLLVGPCGVSEPKWSEELKTYLKK